MTSSMSAGTGFLTSLQRWWHDTGDYAWLLDFLRPRGLLPGLRATICASGVIVGIAAVCLQFVPLHHPAAVSHAIATALAVAGLTWAVYWALAPWPTERVSAVLFILVDLGIIVATVLHADPLQAMGTTTLFALPGAYIVFFHGPRMHSVHLVLAVLTIVGVGLWLGWSTQPDAIALAVSKVAIGLVIVAGILPVLQFAFWLIRHSSVESLIDPLTALSNRRGLDNHLERIAVSSRGGELCVIAIDLDGFKGINDRFGHQAGDEVLVRTSRRISETVRQSALVARTGGEEFVVVERSPAAAAGVIGERIRDAIRAAAHPPVTASIGVAATAGRDGISFQDALRAADAAMYQAKREGGDRVVIAAHTPADYEPLRPPPE
ncbi:GGDEF domain-containing protein [Mycolicibacterium obuense]|uniref:Putative diguanylate cyclase YcdT n=1 Tax=Mycolicibacterium obuense TaxID=1807 RepID=A0A0J6W039_9MYCO|nr:GGDEF domain-containing protein [Mycolicibacterium obuense]KMO75764.1 putative diguanylate cyclase YcdT [Mycolicibacterium obuense]